MKTHIQFVLGFLAALGVLATTARADSAFGLRGGLTHHSLSYTSTPAPVVPLEFEANSGWLLGVYGASDFAIPFISVDGGIGVEQRAYQVSGAGIVKKFAYRNVLLDGVVRVGIPIFGLGLGPYASLALPNVDTEIAGIKQPTHSLGAEGLKNFDFGGVASARLRLPLVAFALTADVRHLFGLTNLATAAGSEAHTREWQFLAGIEFGSSGAADPRN